MRHFHNFLLTGWTHFWTQLFKALKNPIFLILTVVGNVALFSCAFILFIFETGINPGMSSFADAVWWAFSTMTTVGYGDIVPITAIGRLVAALLVFTGGVLFFSFLALLGSSFTELEFLELRKEVRVLRHELAELKQILTRPSNDR